MPLIEWDERFSVKHEMIDSHHQHLVDLLNRTYDDFTSGAPAESLGNVIHDLLNYATYHFITEERSMAENGFPDLAEHREEHSRFVLKIVRSSGSRRTSMTAKRISHSKPYRSSKIGSHTISSKTMPVTASSLPGSEKPAVMRIPSQATSSLHRSPSARHCQQAPCCDKA